MNKIDRDYERLVKDAADKGAYNWDLNNSHITSNLK